MPSIVGPFIICINALFYAAMPMQFQVDGQFPGAAVRPGARGGIGRQAAHLTASTILRLQI